MFLPRLKVFDYSNNKYFKPNGTFNTLSAKDDRNIPNCTIFALLRAHEEMDAIAREKGIACKGSTGYHNAKLWWEETGYPKGSEIREGAIAVFDGNCGHVGVVEKVKDSTHAKFFSESSYSSNKSLRDWHFFNLRQDLELVVGKATIKGVGKLLGFIYIPINDKRVARDTTKEQVEITEDYVNVRTGASTDYAVVNQGCFCPTGIFNLKSSKLDGQYVWYEIDDGHWVREGEWLKHYPKEDDEDISKLRLENAELKARLEEIRKAGGWK